jgi:hypothetical protein
MSALGHKRTLDCGCGIAALLPKAAIAERDRHVRFVPLSDLRAIRVAILLQAAMRGNDPAKCPRRSGRPQVQAMARQLIHR